MKKTEKLNLKKHTVKNMQHNKIKGGTCSGSCIWCWTGTVAPPLKIDAKRLPKDDTGSGECPTTK